MRTQKGRYYEVSVNGVDGTEKIASTGAKIDTFTDEQLLSRDYSSSSSPLQFLFRYTPLNTSIAIGDVIIYNGKNYEVQLIEEGESNLIVDAVASERSPSRTVVA